MAEAAASLSDQWSDPRWRLNNLYKVKDDDGQVVDFRFNTVQERIYDNLWYRNLILKARQLGCTTLIQLIMLDACVFNSNVAAGVVAQTKPDGQKFFTNKIKFAYDNLPEQIRNVRQALQDSVSSLQFDNGSSIEVGTSLRGGTYQYIHVSEFGKICAKFPEKAEEIVTGTLETVSAENFIFIESTAEGQAGDFFDMCQTAQKTAETGQPLSQLDYRFHFFPWFDDPAYTLAGDIAIPSDTARYFENLEKSLHRSFTKGQRAWYAKKAATLGSKMKREYPATPIEAFEAAIEGTYFAREMATARLQRRVTRLPVENVPVDTFWDIGIDDEMAIWFMQRIGPERRMIDYEAQSGEGLGFYAKLLREKPYILGTIYLPHDGSTRRLTTHMRARTIKEMLEEDFRLRPVVVVPRPADKLDAIEASRSFLPRCWFDEERCSEGIKGLDSYRKEWDDKRATWKSRPLHNWASHPADAFQTAALAEQLLQVQDRRPVPMISTVAGDEDVGY